MLEVLRIMSAQLRMYRMRMMSVSKNGDQSNDLQRVNGAVYLFVRSNNSLASPRIMVPGPMLELMALETGTYETQTVY